MKLKIGVVMDPIDRIHVAKDSTRALLLALQSRGAEIYYIPMEGLFLMDGMSYAQAHRITPWSDAALTPGRWCELGEVQRLKLSECHAIFMRKDPPVDNRYLYATYLLERAEQEGVRVFNRPQALRDYNEKWVTTRFPALCPPTLIASEISVLKGFLQQHPRCVAKPLDGMGGAGIFQLNAQDKNATVILETVTQRFSRPCLLQPFIPAIEAGDKRVLVLNGEACPYMLVRVPHPDDFRGNLAAGARAVVAPLTDNEQRIVAAVAPFLREQGLFIVGLDIIGTYLTEINITSPTGVVEINKATGLDVWQPLLDFIWAH